MTTGAVRGISRAPLPGARGARPPASAVVLPVAAPLAIVAGVFAFWGFRRGGYFGEGFYPAAFLMFALLAILVLVVPFPGRLRGPAAVALRALAALAVWTLLSAAWSPAPDTALDDGMRVAMYAISFGVGIWLCLLLGRHMSYALLAIAGAVAGVALLTLLVLWLGHDSAEYFELDTTLRYPVGNRNPNGALFLIGVIAMLGLACDSAKAWWLRGALLGGAVLSMELAVLSQSRASQLAIVLAFAVLVLCSSSRLKVLAWIGMAVGFTLLASPFLLDVFQSGQGKSAGVLPPLRTACASMFVTSLAAAGAGCLAARRESRLSVPPETARRVGMALGGVLVVVVLLGTIKIAASEGGVSGFVDRQIAKCSTSSPDLEGNNSRFGLDLHTERCEHWRVALKIFGEHPLWGEGGGGFRTAYLPERRGNVTPEDPHSIEMLMLSELGLPGFLLLATALGGSLIAILRARRLGPSAVALSAGALAVGTYWFAHASVEWFWAFPGVTAPVFFCLGAACAPSLLAPAGEPRSKRRMAGALAAVVAILAMLPFFFSERITTQVLRGETAGPEDAYSKLEQASDLNPLTDRPLVAIATLAERNQDYERALSALDGAGRRAEEEWTIPYLRARILLEAGQPVAASAELEEALRLNPRGDELVALGKRIRAGA